MTTTINTAHTTMTHTQSWQIDTYPKIPWLTSFHNNLTEHHGSYHHAVYRYIWVPVAAAPAVAVAAAHRRWLQEEEETVEYWSSSSPRHHTTTVVVAVTMTPLPKAGSHTEAAEAAAGSHIAAAAAAERVAVLRRIRTSCPSRLWGRQGIVYFTRVLRFAFLYLGIKRMSTNVPQCHFQPPQRQRRNHQTKSLWTRQQRMMGPWIIRRCESLVDVSSILRKRCADIGE